MLQKLLAYCSSIGKVENDLRNIILFNAVPT